MEEHRDSGSDGLAIMSIGLLSSIVISFFDVGVGVLFAIASIFIALISSFM